MAPLSPIPLEAKFKLVNAVLTLRPSERAWTLMPVLPKSRDVKVPFVLRAKERHLELKEFWLLFRKFRVVRVALVLTISERKKGAIESPRLLLSKFRFVKVVFVFSDSERENKP